MSLLNGRWAARAGRGGAMLRALPARARGLCRWPTRELVELPGVLALLAAAEIGSRCLRLPRLAALFRLSLHWAHTPPPMGLPTRLSAAEVRRLRVVHRAAVRWPFAPGPCLREALVIGFLLRARQPVLRVGVGRRDRGLIGHAWVEVADGAIGSAADIRPLRPLR